MKIELIANFNKKEYNVEPDSILEEIIIKTLNSVDFPEAVCKYVNKRYKKSKNFRVQIQKCMNNIKIMENQESADYVMDTFIFPLFQSFVKTKMSLFEKIICELSNCSKDEFEIVTDVISIFFALFTFSQIELITDDEFFLEDFIDSLE